MSIMRLIQGDCLVEMGKLVAKSMGDTMDSRPATYEHIDIVRGFIQRMIGNLFQRKADHDLSKLASPEVEIFDEFTPKLSASTYGSDEYKLLLSAMKPALDHHYAANSHHPEHYRWHCICCDRSFSEAQSPVADWGGGESHRFCPRCVGSGSVIWEAELADQPQRGIRGMNLLDLVEMICDWKAATMRHADGDILRSIEINQKRFGYSDELKQILLNTVPLLTA